MKPSRKLFPVWPRRPLATLYGSAITLVDDKVANVLFAQGKLPEALTAYRDSLAIRERLAKADPANAGWQADLAASYGKLGRLHLKMEDKAEAMRLFKAGRAVVAPFAERSGHQMWIGYLKRIRRGYRRAWRLTGRGGCLRRCDCPRCGAKRPVQRGFG